MIYHTVDSFKAGDLRLSNLVGVNLANLEFFMEQSETKILLSLNPYNGEYEGIHPVFYPEFIASDHENLFAYYTYCLYLQNQYTTPVQGGESIAVMPNGQTGNYSFKFVQAYNKFVDLYIAAYDVLKDLDGYEVKDWSDYSTFPQKSNQLGI